MTLRIWARALVRSDSLTMSALHQPDSRSASDTPTDALSGDVTTFEDTWVNFSGRRTPTRVPAGVLRELRTLAAAAKDRIDDARLGAWN